MRASGGRGRGITRTGAHGGFSRLSWRLYGWRDLLEGGQEQPAGFGVGLALGLELLAEGGDGLVFRRYERGAIRWRLVGVLDGVLSWPAGVQQDPHAAVVVPLVRDGTALDTLSEGVYGSTEMIGCLRDANTFGGRMSCGVLSVFPHGPMLDPC